MKFDALKLTKVIEENYSHLMPDFFAMQTEYLASLNVIYHDLDASLIAMVLTSQLYKNAIEDVNSKEKVSLKYFYQKGNFKVPLNTLKIKDLSLILNVPRETVRRKKEKIIKDNFIILDTKKKMYTFNTNIVEQKILYTQIDNLSKFISKFSFFFSQNKLLIKKISKEEVKKDVEEKFLLYLTKFLDFQISYFSKMKTLIDIESIFIFLLCNLNTTTQIKHKHEPMTSKAIFSKINNISNTLGLNATSISEITKVPRTTVLRKIANLEKIGMIKKDQYKRYSSDDSKKILSIMNYNVKLIGFFFSQCLETYSIKS